MCGISAVFWFGGNAIDDLADLRRMHDALVHRGPDGEGSFFVDAQFAGGRYDYLPAIGELPSRKLMGAIAVRRLRVSDLRAEADQPLVSADGRICVVFNGAIYNFRELRGDLVAAGHRFNTTSDTEVVLEAYRAWGPACFERFNGMWGVLILDLARRKLLGSRDRLGIKPLFYAVDGSRMLFCSEPAALANAHSARARVEPARLFEFLSGYPPRSNALTFFRDVHPVPAATWFELDLQGPVAAPEFMPYWNLADHYCPAGSPSLTFAQAAERYRDLLTSAVTLQSQADAKVGSMLSGGLDTSTIVTTWAQAAVARGSPSPETYSIAWDDPQMSERPYQEAVAAKAGATSHILTLTPAVIWDSVDQVVRALGQPLLGQELIAQYHAYRFAREKGAVVVLDGNGSDEVQAGLPPYEAEMVLERLGRLDLVGVVNELRGIARNYDRSFVSVVRQYLSGPLKRKLREWRGLPRYPWLDHRAVEGTDPNWAIAHRNDRSRDHSPLNRLLYRETRHTNVPTVLMYADRNAMAHSIEARFPFLDHRLVEFCFSQPATYKVGFGQRKRLLLDMARDCLPSLITERKDKKYFVLLTNWMPLREHAGAMRDAASHPGFSRLPWVDVRRMRRFVDDYLAGVHDNAYAVWRIYTASRWFELHGL